MNSGGDGRAGRGLALNRLIENAKLKQKQNRKRQYQKAYDQHEFDGSDPDYLEAEPA